MILIYLEKKKELVKESGIPRIQREIIAVTDEGNARKEV